MLDSMVNVEPNCYVQIKFDNVPILKKSMSDVTAFF